MIFNFCTPIENFYYLGTNQSPNDMWVAGEDFHKNIFPFVIDEEYGIEINKFESYNLINSDSFSSIDAFSQMDQERMWSATSAFYFKCRREDEAKVEIRINLILLLFRILYHSNASCKYYVNLDFPSLSKKITSDWLYALADIEMDHNVRESDLSFAKTHFLRLIEFYDCSYRAKHALNFLFLSYTSFYWQEVFALLFISLETLFSPPNETNITNTIISGTVNFLNDPILCPKNKLNNLYKLRSDIVHGRILIDLDFKLQKDNLVALQKIVLACFKKIVIDDLSKIYKKEQQKEDYLNNLHQS